MEHISFSYRGDELYEDPAIHRAVHSINEDTNITYAGLFNGYRHVGETERDDLVQEYVRSRHFQRLAAPAKQLCLRALSLACETDLADRHWAIENPTVSEGLLRLPTRLEIPATNYDGWLLSGLFALDITSRQRDKLLSQHEAYGFANRFDMTVFLGACVTRHLQGDEVLQTGNGDYLWGRDASGMEKRILIGGDMHGDFRLGAHRRLKDGNVISPLGTPVEFAPVIETHLRAYHSVETDIVAAAVYHLQRVMPDAAARQLVYEDAIYLASQAFQQSGQPREILFADYGNDNTEPFLTPTETPEGVVLTDLFVTPTRRSLRLRVLSTEDALTFTQVEDGQALSETISISNDEMHLFLMALLTQSAQRLGRTAPSSLIEIMRNEAISPTD